MKLLAKVMTQSFVLQVQTLRLIRFLDLRTTKDAAKHSAEIHEFYRKAPEMPVVEDDAADVELDAALKEAGVTHNRSRLLPNSRKPCT